MKFDPSEFDKVDGRHAILIDRRVELCNLFTWARWFEAASTTPGPDGLPSLRHVALDTIGAVWVSTVFIGANHQWALNGPGLWFETMAFGPAEEQEVFGRKRLMYPELGIQQRYATWEEAEAGHARVVARIRRQLEAIEAIAVAAKLAAGDSE